MGSTTVIPTSLSADSLPSLQLAIGLVLVEHNHFDRKQIPHRGVQVPMFLTTSYLSHGSKLFGGLLWGSNEKSRGYNQIEGNLGVIEFWVSHEQIKAICHSLESV
jgi:hypothetical protein